ncbi:MAG: heme-binding domain-containing protein [bacterium]|nr:heme-binding domain-containing protein [bacterium]
MRTALKYFFIGLAALFVLSQFIRPDTTNPPVDATERLEASAQVPSEVAAILKRSCNDCHTHETVHPWYSQITPVNWWLKSHIDDGREHLNFSTWATYAPQRKERRLDEICEVVESGEMPLPSYLWGHPDAKLSQEESGLLCTWARSAKQSAESP